MILRRVPCSFVLFTGVVACAKTSTPTGTIVAAITLNAKWDATAITGVVLALKATSGSGFGIDALAATEGTSNGRRYTYEYADCDGDGVKEICVTLAENPFSVSTSGSTFSLPFTASFSEAVTLSLTVTVNLSNSRSEALTKTTYSDGTALRFISGASQTVTIDIPCRLGTSCAGSSLALTGTEPASPANSLTPRVKGSGDSAWTIRLYSDAACAGTDLASGTGADLAASGLLVVLTGNATTSIYAKATDTLGNVSSCVGPLSYTHDSILPTTPGSLAFSPTSPANNNTPSVRGTADTGATVRVFNVAACDGGSIVASASGAAFSDAGIALSVSDNTTTTFSANAADLAGNVSSCSTSATFVEDSNAPSAPVGTGVLPQGPANNNAPVVTGVAEADSTIWIYAGVSTCVGTPTTGPVNDAGQFAAIVAVSDNTSTIFYGRAVDPAGNQGSCAALNAAIPYIEDSAGPASPVVPDLNATSDTGTLTTDNITSDSTPTFTGSVEGFAMVSLLVDGGIVVGTASTAADGTYSVTSSALTDGVYAFAVKAQDDAGNVSDASTAQSVTIDTSAPAEPAAPDLDAGVDTGSSNSDNITSVTTPTFDGVVEANAMVTLYKDGASWGAATANGSGSYALTATSLSDGTYAFTVKATDTAGNTSDASASLAVTIDTTIATPSAPDLDAGVDTGSSNSDNITSVTTPTFNGTAETNATVGLYHDGGALVGSATATGAGLYAVTASTLSDGVYALFVRATDPAGNVSDASASLAVTIDTATATPAAPDLDPASDMGASSTDNLTNDTTPTFTGTVEANATVSLYHSGTVLVGTATANGAGAYSVTSSALTEGNYAFTVKAVDIAGNEATSSSLPVTIDTTPLPAPVGAPDLTIASDTGASNTDNITGDTTPTFTGVGVTPNATVRLYASAALVGSTTADGAGAWTVTASTLAEGDYVITARAVDTAGNESADSPSLAVTIDSLVDCPPVGPKSRLTPDGPVYAMVRSGCTTYLGGSFTRMERATGGGAVLNNTTGEHALAAPLTIDNNGVYSVASDDAGGWYIGGNFTSVNDAGRNRLAKINADGTLGNWNPNASGMVRALVVIGGTVYVGGGFITVGGTVRSNLAAIDTDGGVLPWNPSADGVVYALAGGGGSIYAGGSFTTIGGTARSGLAAIDPDGGLLDWNPTANGTEVSALAVTGGQIYAGGDFTTIGGTSRNRLAAIDGDGGLLPWNPNAGGSVLALAVSGSTIYAGGVFTTIGGTTRNRLAAIGTDGALQSWDPNASNTVLALAVSGSTLYVGGALQMVGAVTRRYVAAIGSDGTLQSWEPNANADVYALAANGSQVFAGGYFSKIGGAARNNLAAIDLDAGLLEWNPSANNTVRALATLGSAVYAGGAFTAIDGGTRNYLAAIGGDGTLLPWNPNASSSVYALTASGSTIYAGGYFTSIGLIARNRVAAIGSDSTLQSWNPNASAFVNALAVSGSRVYVGGGFTSMSDAGRSYLAAIETDGGLLSWNPSADGVVNTLAAGASTVYVGGSFTAIGGQTRTSIAGIDSDGGVVAWNPGTNGTVYSLAVNNGTVFVGGSFTTAGGQTRNRLAALVADGGQLLSWNPNAGYIVNSLLGSTVTIFAGGYFTTIGGASQTYLAPIDAITGLLE